MPTTVQQPETLPEGLVTLEQVTAKVPLIEIAEAPTTETTPKVEEPTEAPTEEAAKPTEPKEETKEEPKEKEPEEPKVETPNLALFETAKHVINCSKKFDKVTMDVNIVKEKQAISGQRCYFMTIHDIGYDNSQFDEFINSQCMSGLRTRSVWLNVNLPGQEIEATDLTITKYPTLEELADELVTVLDYFKLSQVVLLGEGTGATICTHFAMKYPTRCYGLMCIEPIVSSASVMQSLKHKIQSFTLNRQQSLNGKDKKQAQADPEATVEATNENESFHLQPVDNTVHEKFKNRNVKNMTLFTDAFLNRTNLLESISKLRCDTLIATNKNSTGYSESKKFYRAINEWNRNNFKSLVNTPFIELEQGPGRILENSTEQFATSVQYFLQGIGLLSAMPLKMSLVRQSSLTPQTKTEDSTTAAVAETPAATTTDVIVEVDTTEKATTEKAE